MFGEYAGFQVLQLFLRRPFHAFHVREIARETRVSVYSAKRFADRFHHAGLLHRKKSANLVLFSANLREPAFRALKRAFSLLALREAGLVAFLVKKMRPVSVVLFGSVARGEDAHDSDLDLLVLSGKKKPSLEVFEKRLGREIALLAYPAHAWEKKAKKDKPFYQEILRDGVVLYGAFPFVA